MDDNLLEESAAKLFSRYDSASPDLAALWAEVEEAGFLPTLLSEDQGGYGLSAWEATAPLRQAAERGLVLPLAETMAAHWLLAGAGLTPPPGILSVTCAGSSVFPWGRQAAQALRLSGGLLQIITPANAAWQHDTAICGHPLDHLLSPGSAVTEVPLYLDPAQADAVLAMLRSLQISAALTGVLDMCRAYAAERVQFGRALAAFQVIQQYLAVIAMQTAAARAAAQMAAAAFDARHTSPAEFFAMAAAAKIRCGEAAGLVADLAHQIHGAIGFSQEYPLHRLTRSLWTWRDLDGSETDWSERLAHALLIHEGAGVWDSLTRLQPGDT